MRAENSNAVIMNSAAKSKELTFAGVDESCKQLSRSIVEDKVAGCDNECLA